MNLATEDMGSGVRCAEEAADQSVGRPEEHYRARFPLDVSTRIGSSGGEFAQDVFRYFRQHKFRVVDEEPTPPGLVEASARRFGYGRHSARHGNICTPRQLRQLVEEALGHFKPADAVWEKDGRYYDAMRPTIEPNGLSTPESIADHRSYHLGRVKRVFENSDVFHFTLEMTEAWEHEPSGTVYPVAPATIIGLPGAASHRLRSFTPQEICEDLNRFFALCKTVNPDIRFLLSLSPEPVQESCGPEHQGHANKDAKSVLRAAAAHLYRERADVDYIPVYELALNLHSLRNDVKIGQTPLAWAAMDVLLQQCSWDVSAQNGEPTAPSDAAEEDDELQRMLEADALCEEILNETFKS